MSPREHDSEDLEKIRRLEDRAAESRLMEAIGEHSIKCRDEGPLCAVAEKVDKLRTASARQNGILAFLTVVGPIVLGLLLNNSANSRLQKQIDTAADVARVLKDLQEAARHSELTPGTVHQADTRIAVQHTPWPPPAWHGLPLGGR
jgi:hypothetical protein